MADSFTANRSIIQPQVGADSGTWGGLLNSGAFAQLDLILGNTEPVTITAAPVTLTQPQWNNLAINLTGALVGNQQLILPFITGSTTVAVGGVFVVENLTTNPFSITVLTQVAGSTGVVVPQGLRTWLFSDGTNVWYADDAAVHIQTCSGNPNGVLLVGVQGSANNPPSVAWDYTNSVLYFCTTSSTSTPTNAIWTNVVASGAPLPTPQGYLTPVSNTPVITADSIAATSIYYTPFEGSWGAVHNGTSIIAYQFSQMQLVLTSSQAANQLYDVYLAYNGGIPVIGTGPSWSSGTGGSVTAGSCARGTGAGGAAIQRSSPSGLWVNSASMSLIYNTGSGNNTITVAAGQGILLGLLYIDATAGQLTCHRSWGQNRKFGISNAYNHVPITLQEGDSTASWNYGITTTRASNAAPATWNSTEYNVGSGTTCNGITVLCCLADEPITVQFEQSGSTATTANTNVRVGVGLNSTTAFSGSAINGGGPSNYFTGGRFNAPPSLGINTFQALETYIAGANATFFGTELNMVLTAQWRG